MSESVLITEVVTRDGLQIEPQFVETEYKIALLEKLMDAGVKRFEVSSFVHPKLVPQMRDAEEVFRGLKKREGVTLLALALNPKGVERAIQVGVDEINFVFSVSETHNQKNAHRSVAESLENTREMFRQAAYAKIPLNVGMATALGCPFEGFFPTGRLLELIDQLTDMGITSISLADTTGMAYPTQVSEICRSVLGRFPGLQVTLHLHNTRGMGAANMMAGIAAGIRSFDSSLAGLGGCPFAPGASGNICTEDMVHMLELCGYSTGIDVDRLIPLAQDLERKLGRKLPGQVMKAKKSLDLHPKEWEPGA